MKLTFENIDELTEAAKFIQDHNQEHDFEAFVEWCAWQCTSPRRDLYKEFQDVMQGEYTTRKDFAESFVDDVYDIASLNSYLMHYIDYEQIAADMADVYDFVDSSLSPVRKVYVFRKQ
jgi:antirestriction protein